MAKRYRIITHGCQMNEHDSERLAGLLEADGYTETTEVDQADVVVLNTCCIRENADNKLYGALGNLKVLKQDRPDLQIVVSGCLAQKDRDLIQQKAGHVDVVLGTHNVHRATALMSQARESGPVTEIWEEAVLEEDQAFPSALPARRATDYAAWVTIQIGCDNNCAFCIVPSVRGTEISRPAEEIVAEVADLARQGVTEVTLLGQNVNSYGRDLALAARRAGQQDMRLRPQFAQLLRQVGAVEGIRRVRYTSPHPKDMTADVFEAMANTPAVVPHLHYPLQSGSDRILAAMHRGYSAERYLAAAAQARATIDDLAITTDIIVGFPGETEDDFEQTMAVAAEAQFDNAYTFVFSPRPGTEAAEMVDRFCDPDEVKDRYARLRTVIERSARQRHEARVGRIEEVVIEGPSKTNPALLTGRTAQNKLVHFPSEPIRPGTYAQVEVTEAATQYLMGRLVEVTEPAPSHPAGCEFSPVTTLRFDVAVAADQAEVRRRLNEAKADPATVVRWFTDDPDVTASVASENEHWRLAIEGDQFRANGTVAIAHRDVAGTSDGTTISTDVQIKGKGLLGLAGPVLTLAAGRIQAEATKALTREFGTA